MFSRGGQRTDSTCGLCWCPRFWDLVSCSSFLADSPHPHPSLKHTHTPISSMVGSDLHFALISEVFGEEPRNKPLFLSCLRSNDSPALSKSRLSAPSSQPLGRESVTKRLALDHGILSSRSSKLFLDGLRRCSSSPKWVSLSLSVLGVNHPHLRRISSQLHLLHRKAPEKGAHTNRLRKSPVPRPKPWTRGRGAAHPSPYFLPRRSLILLAGRLYLASLSSYFRACQDPPSGSRSPVGKKRTF